ncbi:PREDICTED: malignant fibrous histiocytoma-amplified sequence 1 homolog isoform X2 [Branchiostoma belcheri]|uniref:Leucine-rich repeat protein SHOC-2 n=1 Tax=Branchiostoma belcheri TaxID=7741 RepID=A0A6P4ZE96_BRABE|nr:PREDICTED: malignant fibrous histiocytoma-amplified sequence 1 homolog isoform X2 [Branchiostoma belcheri]
MKLEQLEVLYLSYNKNITLPDEMCSLVNLSLLDLGNCDLKTVPASVTKLSQLNELSLWYNKEIKLPDEMSSLVNLTHLDLDNCDLDTLPPVVLKLSNLQELDLSGNQISLPDELYKLQNIKVLGLCDCNLATVPPVVLKLTQLEELDLSRNSGIHLPDELSGLTNIRVLKLGETGMVTVPPVVWTLTKLEWLDLDSNPLQTLPAGIGQITSIKHLDLFDCKLRTLPSEIWRLTQLEWLDLSSNALQTLPMEIGKLTNIKHLDLSNCKLRTLPSEVGRLAQLEWLDLSSNALQTLPMEIGKLTNIKHLDLSKSELHTLPPEMWRLTQLEWLDLSSNALQTLPAEIGQLTNIEHLDLSECELRTLPSEVWRLTQLEWLNPSSNPLQTLPAEIGQLTNIEHLDLSNCELRTLPPEMWRLTQLEWLNLSSNPLQTLPAEIGKLTNVKHLTLSKCELHTLPPEVWRLTQLEWLNPSSNPLQTLPAEIGQLTNIEHLDLSNCELRTLPPEMLRLTQLEWLDLSSVPLQTLPAEIGQITNVKHLDLSKCKLRTLPPELWRLTQLEWLNLSSNPLQTLPAEIGQLTNIKHLDLSNCELRTLPSEVGRLTQLLYIERLDLSWNSLDALPVEIAQLTNVSGLDVIGNPLIKPPAEVCSHGINAIRQYFHELEHSEEEVSARLKVVVLGEKMAGKTSLVQTLSKGQSTLTEEEDRTHCVEITQWAPDDNITFEVYDFGGHDVYHLTHQFFLTPDAFYLLVVNLQTYRCTEHDYMKAVGFWLDTLNAHVPGAVVSLIGSKKDLCPSADVERKTHDIQKRVKQQEVLWERHLKQQIETLELVRQLQKPGSSKSVEDLTQHLTRVNNLLSKRLRIIEDVHSVSVKQKAAILAIFTISSYIKLKDFLLKTARNTTLFPTLRRILPKTWVDFKRLLQNQASNTDADETYAEMSSLEKVKQPRKYWLKVTDCERLGQLAGLSSDRLEPVLSYLKQVGTILRYTDIPELKAFIFHDPPRLIDIFKDLFHHDTDTLLSAANSKLDRFTSPQLVGFRSDLRDRGLIKKEVIACLLPPNINPDIVTALMQNFGLCFEIEAKDKTDPSKHISLYKIPWYLDHQMPGELKDVWPEVVPEDQEQLPLMCDIRGFCPRGLFQRFSVGIHPLVKDRVDWKDGVMAYHKHRDYPILVCSKRGADDTYITMATRGRLDQADEMWGVVHPLLEVLVQLLQEWPGVLYSLHVTCAHCIKAGLEKPHQYDLRDRTAEDGRDVRCPGVMHTAKTSADLVYRPSRLSVAERRASLTEIMPPSHGNDCYKMTSDPLGVALIISNTNFTDQTWNRPGGKQDLDNLRKICEKLKLQQEIREDLTAQEMSAVAKEVSQRDHSNYDCFVLFLLSHGVKAGVSGTDGQHVPVDSIISSFQACKSLVGKPKLFFIQACRGVDTDKGVDHADTTPGEASSTSQAGTEASDGTAETTELPPPPTAAPPAPPAPVESPDAGERTLPTASDRLVMYATVHGHVSWRNSNTGTWLIQVLADVITEHAETEELQDMLRRVNAKVADFKTQNQEYKQQPEVTHTLRKKLYFFPRAVAE